MTMMWWTELKEAWGGLGAWRRRLLLAVACGALTAWGSQLAEMPWRSALRGTDNSFYYFWLRSLMVDGDWDFRNDLQECNTLPDEFRQLMLDKPLTPVGRLPNKYGIGWALLSAPFYVAADGIVAAGRALGVWTLARDGYNPVYQICLHTGNLGLAAMALLLAWRSVRRWCGDPGAALGAVVLIWAASPQLYYQTMKLTLTHNDAFLAVALMVWALWRAKEAPGRLWPWVLAGAGLGLAVTVRFQLAVFALVPAWAWWRWEAWGGGWRRAARAAGAGALGALPLVALQLWAWHVVYGSWLVFTYGHEGEGFHWLHPEVAGVLFSPWHGLFYWHPFLLVGGLGLAGLAWRERTLGAAGAAAALAMLYVNASWWCWWFAGSFGSRAFDAVILFFMAGLAWLLVTAGAKVRRAVWALGTVAVAWNFYLMAVFYTSAIPRDVPVTWLEMLHAGGRMVRVVADFFHGGGGGP